MRREVDSDSTGVRLRPLCESDADAVAAAYRATFGDELPVDAARVLSWLRIAAGDPESDPGWMQVVEEAGRVVGFGDITVRDDGEVALEVAAPGHYDLVLEWAEASARDARVARLRTFFPEGHELGGIVARRCYRPLRFEYTMGIDLDANEGWAPALPVGLAIGPYQPSAAEVVRAALNEVFAADPFFHHATVSHFEETYLHAPGFDPSLWLLAWDGVDLAGFVLAYPERYGDATLGWIEALGVRERWRRRGLGEALLRLAFAALQGRGCVRAGLGVDADNATNALSLYEHIGMKVVVRWDNCVLEL